jgi:hypothetical protein
MLRVSRGWSSEEWDRAVEALTARRLLRANGAISEEGVVLRSSIERRTDELAVEPYTVLGDARCDELLSRLRPAASTVMASGEVSLPNPMGLPSSATE